MSTPSLAQTPPPGPWSIPGDAEIRRILTDRVDLAKQSVGIVVGIVDPSGRRIISYGAAKDGDKQPPTADTEFEIGAVTQAFTGLLLAEMVSSRDVTLDDPVQKGLPAKVKVPAFDDKQITLLDLANHTSGLPRLPDNLYPKDPANPYADYTAAQLYDFLSHTKLAGEIGEEYQYSDAGYGLLGHVLGVRAGKDYAALVRERIAAPLEMKDTAVTLSPDQRARLAAGHDAMLKPAEAWTYGALEGAGALHSTANDLLTFLAAEIGIADSPLKAAMDRTLLVRHPESHRAAVINDVGLGWHIMARPRSTVVWNGGATGGMRAFAGYDPDGMTGVVVLSNSAANIDDIGVHILIGTPLAKAAAK